MENNRNAHEGFKTNQTNRLKGKQMLTKHQAHAPPSCLAGKDNRRGAGGRDELGVVLKLGGHQQRELGSHCSCHLIVLQRSTG